MKAKTRLEIVQKTLFACLRGATVLGMLILCACQSPEDLLTGSPGLIFVKSNDSGTLDVNFIEGESSNLFLLSPISPNGEVKNLTNLAAGGAVADPEISYDGLKVLFTMRKGRSGNFDIYEMNVDGTNLRQVTTTPYDEADPAYLPNGKIVFTCNRRDIRDEYERREVENLHTMDTNGGNVECISFSNSDDFDPIVLRDGRVAWTRWEHHGTQNRFPLFFTHPDGQSTFLLFGPHNNGSRNFFHPRELDDGRVVAIMSDEVLGDEGPVVILNSQTTADPPQSGDIVNLTPDAPMGGEEGQPSFKYPFPLPDGRLVVSYSKSGNTDYGLYTLDRDGANLTLLYNDPASQELDAVVVAPRPRPPVIPETIDKSANSGVFVNQDVYFRQANDGQARPDRMTREIKQVMVIEGIPVPPNERSMEIGETSFERKRVLGVAPVYDDGSFAVRVPANTAISFNTLDSLGRAVVIKRSWLFARPGERFENCTGCHGPRGQKSNSNPIAKTQEPTDLNVPVNQRQAISFKAAIEPIVAQKCLPCHDGTNPAAALNLSLAKTVDFSIAYETLMARNSGNQRMVERDNPPFARRSRLIDVMLGVGSRPGSGRHPVDASALTEDEIRKFITWVDLGGQYH